MKYDLELPQSKLIKPYCSKQGSILQEELPSSVLPQPYPLGSDLCQLCEVGRCWHLDVSHGSYEWSQVSFGSLPIYSPLAASRWPQGSEPRSPFVHLRREQCFSRLSSQVSMDWRAEVLKSFACWLITAYCLRSQTALSVYFRLEAGPADSRRIIDGFRLGNERTDVLQDS